MKLSNAMQRLATTLKTYIDKVVPKKISELEIDIEVGTVKTVNGIEPDSNGNIDITVNGTGSWNDLKDKPFYEEFTSIEEGTLEFQDVNISVEDWYGNYFRTDKDFGFSDNLSDVFSLGIKYDDTMKIYEKVAAGEYNYFIGNLDLLLKFNDESDDWLKSRYEFITNEYNISPDELPYKDESFLFIDNILIDEFGSSFRAFYDGSIEGHSDSINVDIYVNSKRASEVHPIDEKFIPDTIARTSDLLSSGVATFPVHTYQRVSDKASIYKVNLADLKKGILYSGRGLLESSGTDITLISFVIVCEDGTEKNIAADDGDDLWSIFKNTKDWVLRCQTGNESYRIDTSDLSTAANVACTSYYNQKYLDVYNEREYTPTNDYHPATKKYVDDTATTAANAIKNDLLNGAGEAYDTLKELGELIDDNVDAIEALEIIATGKANISDIPTKVSELTNDSGFITEAPQADWNQNDETATNYIKNKPILATSEEIKALFN